jgi:hypothetical protein
MRLTTMSLLTIMSLLMVDVKHAAAQDPETVFCLPLTPAILPDGRRVECADAAPETTPPPSGTTYNYNAQDFLEENSAFNGYHLGEDWNGSGGGDTDQGHPVYAIGRGIVVYVRDTTKSDSWGNIVVIRHNISLGSVRRYIYSLYGHLEDILISSGDTVVRGQQIGTIGDANGFYRGEERCGDGIPACSHLHFEIQLTDRMEDCGKPVSECVGPGYARSLQDNSELQLHTNPSLFIRLFKLESAGPKPLKPTNLRFVDDPSGDYFDWNDSIWAVYYNVYLDGRFYGRTYESKYALKRELTADLHHWYVVARNYFGGNISDISEITTINSGGCGDLCDVPIVQTDEASQVDEDSALLAGVVTANGRRTEWWFAYGTSEDNYDKKTPRKSAGSGYLFRNISAVLESLECGRTYHYQLFAINNVGQGMGGGDKTFTTDSCGGPSAEAPPRTSLKISDVGCNTVLLKWPFQKGTFHSIYRDGTLLHRVGSRDYDGIGTFIDGLNLIPNTGYDYLIRAYNQFGTDESSVHIFYPPYVCGGSGAPPTEFLLQVSSQLQRCAGGSPAVLLEWIPLYKSESLYRVFKEDGMLLAEVETDQSGPFHVVHDGLIPGQSYSFYVEGYDYQGNAVRTNTTTAYITSDQCQLGGDTAVLPGDFLVWHEPVTCINSVPQVRLRWTTAAGAQSYRLERLHEDLTISISNIIGTSHLDTDRLKPGSFHSYNVFAVNTTGETAAQKLRIFVPSDVCGDTGLPGEFLLYLEEPYCVNGKPTIRLNWFPPEGNINTSHRWRHSTGTAVGSVNTNHSGFTKYTHEEDAGLSAGKTFGIFMQVEDAADPSRTRESNVVAFSIPNDICGPPSAPPLAQTQPARGVLKDAALLSGAVNPNGTATTAHFEWGLTTSYGNTTAVRVLGNSMSYLYPEIHITGLSCGTTYHYRAVGTSAFGTTYGTDRFFTTTPCPPPPNVAPLFSFVEPNGTGDESDGSFLIKWSDSDPDSNSVITLAYSSHATCSAPTVIISNISEDDLVNSYRWDTSALPEGAYYLQAVIDDGIAPVVVVCSGTPIVVSHPTTSVRVLSQSEPGTIGKDIWTTSVYSYAPGGNTPGGGLDDHALVIGGWGDSYYSLIEFDLAGMPQQAVSAYLELFCFRSRSGVTTGFYLDRVTASWDWRTQGTGRDRNRLWWADRPATSSWNTTQLAAPQIGQWYRIDITNLYNAWQAGTYPNYGLQLRPTSTSNRWSEFYSANYLDDPSFRPRLVVERATQNSSGEKRSIDFEREEGKYLFINDGSQQGLDITGDFTVEAWVKPESISAAHTIVSKWGAGQGSYWIGFELDGPYRKLFVNLSPNGTTEVDKKLIYDMGTGTWRHLAVSCRIVSFGACDIYVDAQLVGTLTGFPSNIFSGTGRFEVGTAEAGRMHDGLLDEVRVWNKARTQSEIANDYRAILLGTEPGLVAYYSFDGASGSVTDKSLRGNHLTASGTMLFVTTTPF